MILHAAEVAASPFITLHHQNPNVRSIGQHGADYPAAMYDGMQALAWLRQEPGNQSANAS